MGTKTLYKFNFKAMGGHNEIQIFHADQIAAEKIVSPVIGEIKAIEEKYSRYKGDSIISKINSAAGFESITVDEETSALLDYAEACYNESQGLFDITSGILREAWDFKSKKLPSQEQIDMLLPLVGWDKVKWTKPKLFLLSSQMQLDFGGIGKEYAVDKAAGLLQIAGVKNAMINLGGDIRVLGPQADGKPWSIGLQHPRKNAEVISSIAISHGAITTSGDYERFMEVAGKRYSHILNPKTGWPADSFQSVTVISESCLVSGSLCTISMLKGEEEGLKFLKSSKRKFIAVSSSGEVLSFI